MDAPFADPHAAALTVGLAVMGGTLAQLIARRLRIPGIVLLLLAGVVLGPDLLGLVRPRTLGAALQPLIGFAVAVILFEGSLSLDLRRLRRQARPIQLLVTLGAFLTAVGAALCARVWMGWAWQPALLFGTLVMVTGPTVIQPLLQRLRLTHRPHTVLEAEGIFVDAVGAIVAVVALEVALAPRAEALATGLLGLAERVGTGLGVGVVSGCLVAWGLRRPTRVPDALANIFTLAMVLGTFQVSSAIAPESGVIAVIALGLWVGNAQVALKRDLVSFKEQLTVLLVGLLFVLLAANVRLHEVAALGWPGVLTVLCLMFVVRPVTVFLCTHRSDLTFKERLFVAWLGPRGIVAAAVASLFAQRLNAAGAPEAEALRALVFLVIAVTVGVQGLSSGVVATLLGVRRSAPGGYVILGADGLARLLATALGREGKSALLIELTPARTRLAEEAGLKVLFGNGMDARTLLRTEPEGRDGFVGLTPNEAMNLLFAQRARGLLEVTAVWAALHKGHIGVGPEEVAALGGRVLFAGERDLDAWTAKANRDQVRLRKLRLAEPQLESALPASTSAAEDMVLPLLRVRAGKITLIDEETDLTYDDEVVFAVATERAQEADDWLTSHGWRSLPSNEDVLAPTGASPEPA